MRVLPRIFGVVSAVVCGEVLPAPLCLRPGPSCPA